MSQSYLLTPQAQKHLSEIKDYTTAQHGVVKSIDYLAELRRMMTQLAEMPEMGRLRSGLTHDQSLRSFACQKHVIFYTVVDSNAPIQIIAVLHGSMDIPSYFQ